MLNFAGLLNAFILLVFSAIVTYWWKTYDARQAKTKEAATDLHQWRESILLADKTNADAIAKESRERTQWQLKREAESALVAGILEESTEAHKLLASIASTTRHLEGASAELKADMRELRQHVNAMQSQLITLHNSHAARA